MNKYAFLLSAITLIYLSYTLIVETKSNELIKPPQKIFRLVIPAYISDTPLEAELKWKQLKSDRNKVQKPAGNPEGHVLKGKDVLTIGDNKYALYGIFNSSDGEAEKGDDKFIELTAQTFILIKKLSKKNNVAGSTMLKIMQGETLSEGIVLVEVTSNSIKFKHDDNFIEIKLFDANSDS
jgi:hypothetical protein